MDEQRRDGVVQAVEVPYGLRLATAWSWRLLLIGVTVYVLLRLVGIFQVLVVPLLVSVLLVALVRPVHDLMAGRPGRPGLPASLAALLTMLITFGLVAGLFTVIGQQVATGFPTLSRDAEQGLETLQDWLATSPLHLTDDQWARWVESGSRELRENTDALVSGALQLTSTAGHLLTGFFLVLFSTFFFLSGGDRIWAWLVRLFPREARRRVNGAGTRAWATVTSFIRATVIVALVDGVGVWIVAAVLGLPLAVPLGVLVFLGAFVPILGALLTGAVAVLVALVAKGFVAALIMLAGVIVVQQLESHVLQPFLLGRAVRVHPLAVILAIGAGVLVAGIVGALFAVPVMAVLNVIIGYLNGPDDRDAPPPDAGPLADVGTAHDEVDEVDPAAAGPGVPDVIDVDRPQPVAGR